MKLQSCYLTFGKGETALDVQGGGLCGEITLPLLHSDGLENGSLPFPGNFIVGEDEQSAHLPGGIFLSHLKGSYAEDLAKESEALYQQLLEQIGERHLIRVWNMVPAIHGRVGNETRYWQFNRGRQNAFAHYFARSGRSPRFPAATAVGGRPDTPLGVFFLSSPHAPEYFENPRQIPAFEYPREYGPQAPAFSRGTRLGLPEFPGSFYFISGTSAVIGHRSMAENDLEQQLRITWKNLDVISREMGLTRALQGGTKITRLFVIYLRNPEDLTHAKGFLTARTDEQHDHMVFLQADICREELLVEIEVTAIPTALHS